MNISEELGLLNHKIIQLEIKYDTVKAEVAKRFQFYPPPSETVKYRTIKMQINKLKKRRALLKERQQ